MKIKKHTIVLYIAAIAFVAGSSAYIKSLSGVGLVIDAAQAVMLFYALSSLIKEKRVGVYSWLIIAFYMALCVATIMGTKEYLSYLVYAIQGIGATIFIEVELKRNYKEVFRVLRNILFLFLIFNLLLMLIYPNGFGYHSEKSVYYLLGLRIAFTPFVITELFFSFLYDLVNERKKMSVMTMCSILVGLLTVFIEKVTTGILTIGVILVLVFICKERIKKINLYWVYILYSVVFVAIIIFNIQYHIPFLTYFFENILHEDLSFSNRTTIWASAISTFLQKPLIGNGITGGGGVAVQFQYSVSYLSAHNQMLNTLCEGGVIAFSIFVGSCFSMARSLNKHMDKYITRVMVCFVIGFLFVMFTEVQMTKALIFLVFATAANVRSIYAKKVVIQDEIWANYNS